MPVSAGARRALPRPGNGGGSAISRVAAAFVHLRMRFYSRCACTGRFIPGGGLDLGACVARAGALAFPTYRTPWEIHVLLSAVLGLFLMYT